MYFQSDGQRVRSMLLTMKGNAPACYYPTRQWGVWQAEEYGTVKRVRERYQAAGFEVVGTEQDMMGDENYTLIRFRVPVNYVAAYFAQFVGDE